MGWKSTFIAFILILYDCQLYAQTLFLKHYTTESGLPSNEIHHLEQDEYGNLLIATDKGLARFDGYSFEMVSTKKHSINNEIFFIHKTRKNKVFVTTSQGDIYEYKNWHLVDYRYNKIGLHAVKPITYHKVQSFSEFQDSLLLTYNYVENFLTGPAGKVKKLEKKEGLYFDLSQNINFHQAAGKGFNRSYFPVFIISKSKAITEDSIHVSSLHGYFPKLYYLNFDSYELFFLGKNLLLFQNGKRIHSRTFKFPIQVVAPVDNSQFFISFAGEGLKLLKIINGKISVVQNDILNGLTVTHIYKDDQEGFWFSTHENGLFYSYPSKTTYVEKKSEIKSIISSGQHVFVGYTSGEIRVYVDQEERSIFNLPPINAITLEDLYVDDRGFLIAETNKGCFLRYNNLWKPYVKPETSLFKTDKFKSFASISKAFKGKELSIKSVIENILHKNSTSQPLSLYKLLLEKSTSDLDLRKLVDDSLICIKHLSNGKFVVGSYQNGIAMVLQKKVYVLNEGNGLITPFIYSIKFQNDTIWLGTNKGLARIKHCYNDSFEVRYFGIESGLPTIDIKEFTLHNGWIYYKWLNRLASTHIDNLEKIDINAQARLNRVVVNDKTLSLFGSDTFDYKQNAFTFYFKSINLSSAMQQKYRYMLQGFDGNWKTTSERKVQYTNLPPGEYKFKVQAFGPQGILSKMPATYSFTIESAIWQRWWFIGLLIFIFTLLISVFFGLRLKAIKSKDQLLLDLAESQQKALVQLIHPHFIFNILNTVQGAILKDNKLTAASIIARFSKLMRLSMELSKEKLVALDKEIELLIKYLELESIRSTNKFSYKVNLHGTINPLTLYIPPMLIQPFVENAIKHGIMHLTDRPGFIYINFDIRNNVLICNIDDNGIGREKSAAINKNRGINHQSSGIAITLNRLQLLHQQKKSLFYYEVKDKKGEDEQWMGTTIILSIPF